MAFNVKKNKKETPSARPPYGYPPPPLPPHPVQPPPPPLPGTYGTLPYPGAYGIPVPPPYPPPYPPPVQPINPPEDLTPPEKFPEEDVHVVATQSWVKTMLNKFWDWTKYFATQTLQVAGGLHAGRIKTSELQTNDIYTSRFTLLDPYGRPALVYVDEAGNLRVQYDFQDVFVYSGIDGVSIKQYVFRYGTKPEQMVSNFIGLTPYQTLANFIPFESNQAKTFNEKVCYKLCPADGKDVLIDKTLLFTCPQAKRIIGLDVWDVHGDLVREKSIRIPNDRVYRMLTVNMPSFVNEIPFPEGEDAPADPPAMSSRARVVLPGDSPTTPSGHYGEFQPPFLAPPHPAYLFHPSPMVPPIPPTQYPFLMDDIYSKDMMDDYGGYENLMNQPMNLDKSFGVVYENYGTNTYYNVCLKNNYFEQNKLHYIVPKLADA